MSPTFFNAAGVSRCKILIWPLESAVFTVFLGPLERSIRAVRVEVFCFG